jgi:hypothetical protein
VIQWIQFLLGIQEVLFLNPEKNSLITFMVLDHSSHVSSNSTLTIILFTLPSTPNDTVEQLALLLYHTVSQVLVLTLLPLVHYPDYNCL